MKRLIVLVLAALAAGHVVAEMIGESQRYGAQLAPSDQIMAVL